MGENETSVSEGEKVPQHERHHPIQVLLWCVSILAIIVGGMWTLYTYLRPPRILPDGPPVIPALSPSSNWVHDNFESGEEAAGWLSAATRQPNPSDVYAVISGGRYFQVWCKPSPNSGNKYVYRFMEWSSDSRLKIPLPEEGQTAVPIGFGGSGRDLFFYFDLVGASPSGDNK